ncbi:hypothetical protein [Luteitalea sp.]
MRHSDVTDCFLCGEPLQAGQPTDKGHVLPLSFVPTVWRAQIPGPGLLTYPVHRACNAEMCQYERWVLHDLGKAADGAAGTPIRADLRRRYLSKVSDRRIYEAQRAAWVAAGERLALPGGKVVTPYDGAKADRVFRAIVRGYFFHLTGRVIRERTRLDVTRPYSRLEVNELRRDWPFTGDLLMHPELTGMSAVLGLHICCVPGPHSRLRGHVFLMVLWDTFYVVGQVLEPY